MKKRLSLMKVFGAITLLFAATVQVLHADAVTDWNGLIEKSQRNPTTSPVVQIRIHAIVHSAIFDAVNGIERRYTPLFVTDAPPPGARAEAAAVQAAYTALSALMPSKQALYDEQLALSLAKIPGNPGGSQAIADGREWGQSVAQKILAWRANDGFSQVLTYPGISAPGYWRHAPLGSAPAGGLNMTVTLPFSLENPGAFDPGPPYGRKNRMAAMATAAYAADVNDVQARGGAQSLVRTAAQTDLAKFIHVFDVTDINATIRKLVPARATLVENARLFALMNISAHDAGIVLFQAKYKYGLWRPVQAVPYANEDGNPATTADPAWTPVAPTPSHPEYLSGHSTLTSSMLGVAEVILSNNHVYTLSTSNPGAPAIVPVFSSFSALSDAVSDSRVLMGFHFKSCCELSEDIGYEISNTVMRRSLVPLRDAGPCKPQQHGGGHKQHDGGKRH